MIIKNQFVSFNGLRYKVRKSRYTVNASPVHINDYMTFKMEGMPAISTPCTVNPNCLKRIAAAVPDEICVDCFADAVLNCKKELQAALESNFTLLTSGLIPEEWIPIFKPDVTEVRIEAFGDLYNVIQARNYIRIMKKNPHVSFGWFSKNTGIQARAVKIEGVPSNCIFTQSSERKNRPDKKRAPFINRIFTVYTTVKDAARAGHKITCGARHCKSCLRCYRKKGFSLHVSELLK